MKIIVAFAFFALAVAVPVTCAQDSVPSTTASHHTYSGTVASIDATQVVLVSAPAGGGMSISLTKHVIKLDAKTTVTMAGKSAKITDLKEGARIEVATDAADVAISIASH